MLRGPTYDDSYITRKLSQMPGPTFTAPSRGYLQPGKKKKVGRERRSLSPSLPWLWPDLDKYGKGWYRVDFGPEYSTQLCYLPTFRHRYNFLQSYAEGSPHAAYQPTRATSVPPPAKAVTRPRSSSHWATGRVRLSRPTVIPSVRPRSSWYSYWYYPSLGPYSGRLWRTWTAPRYLNPLAGRARSLSPPIRVSTSWTGYPPLAPPPRLLHHRIPPSYYDYDYGYGGYYGYVPPPVRMSRYDTYLEDDLPEPTYLPRYRHRVSDVLDDVDYREKSLPPITTTTDHTRSYSPGMLHDHVDKMRIRLKSLAYSLDPSGPVPEIIVPDRPKKSSAADDKKYSSALEFTELPKLASRRQRYYPEDQHLKDNLRIQCLSHYKTTRTAADYWKPKQYIPTEPLKVMPDSSRYSKFSSTKWEEPDTVFGAPSDKKPFSKAVTDGTTEEANEEKKERRKKKKSKERDTVAETVATPAPAPATIIPSDVSTSEVEAVSAPSESEPVPASTELPVEEEVLDDKERKRLEKKKRKAEREAAAKAAMEAELAALAAAEAELARLEAESSALKPDAHTPAEVPAPAVPEVPAPADVVPAPTESADPPAEVKSESAAEKCESSTEVVCEGVCVPLGEPVPSHSPRHLPLQEDHESHHETQQLPAIQEPLPAPEPPLEEPQVEPSMEVSHVEPPVEEPNVELPEEPQLEAQLEIPVNEPKAEDLLLESLVEPQAEEARVEPPAQEPHVEETQAEPPVEGPQVEEPQVEPPVEVPQVEIPQVEPPVEAHMEAPYVKDPVAVVEEAPVVESSVEEEPRVEARRAAAYDEDAGWLDAWAGEAAAAGAADETGPHLGAEVSSGEMATTHGGPHHDDDDDDDPAH